MIDESIGKLISRHRMAVGLSHRDVGDRCAASIGDVKGWEADVLLPTPRQWARLTNLVSRGLKKHTSQYRELLSTRAPDTTHQIEREMEATPVTAGEATYYATVVAAADAATIQQAVRAARLEAGLDQGELGALVGTSGQAVSQWEIGTCLPVRENLDRLVDLGGPFAVLAKWRDETREIPKPDGGPDAPRAAVTGRVLVKAPDVINLPAPKVPEAAREKAAEIIEEFHAGSAALSAYRRAAIAYADALVATQRAIAEVDAATERKNAADLALKEAKTREVEARETLEVAVKARVSR